jgi:hypothetical protein
MKAADVNQSLYSDTRILIELFQSMICEDSVLVSHLHKVCGDAQRAQVEKREKT